MDQCLNDFVCMPSITDDGSPECVPIDCSAVVPAFCPDLVARANHPNPADASESCVNECGTPDCNGDWGGTAVEDDCGVCDGDNSSCSGCMSETADNYNEDALVDDGSCIEPPVEQDTAGAEPAASPVTCSTDMEATAYQAAGCCDC